MIAEKNPTPLDFKTRGSTIVKVDPLLRRVARVGRHVAQPARAGPLSTRGEPVEYPLCLSTR